MNGYHRCIVTEALGPSVAAVKYEPEGNRLPRHISHIVATQCAKGLAYLHSCGIVHGGAYITRRISKKGGGGVISPNSVQ